MAQWKRVGAIANDGFESSATGRGACSHHGGVKYWKYQKVLPSPIQKPIDYSKSTYNSYAKSTAKSSIWSGSNSSYRSSYSTSSSYSRTYDDESGDGCFCFLFKWIWSVCIWILMQFLPSITHFGPSNFAERLNELWKQICTIWYYLNKILYPLIFIIEQLIPSVTEFGPKDFDKRLDNLQKSGIQLIGYSILIVKYFVGYYFLGLIYQMWNGSSNINNE